MRTSWYASEWAVPLAAAALAFLAFALGVWADELLVSWILALAAAPVALLGFLAATRRSLAALALAALALDLGLVVYWIYWVVSEVQNAD